ncbi:MAG: MBL fold metallo-hydrolase [Candidatus Heimdallarchaeota archaeon]|nr:MAG: MBL fold metallo-hydrolase [Candidatus Heimdallarchaeota archaeon]
MKYEIVDDYLIWTEEGYGNSVAIDLGGKVYIIDSMLNWELAEEWRKIVEQHFNVESVSGLILTHHHADHTFGNQVFSDLPIVSTTEIRRILKALEKEIWPKQTKEDLDEWEAGGYGVKNLQITHPNICFEQQLKLYGERTLELIQADGHTSGSTYLWEPESKTLIAGDLVFHRQFPYGGDDTCDPILWQAVIERFIAFQPKIIISGHGPPASMKDLDEINIFFQKSIEFMRKKLKEGLKLNELVNDPDFPEYYSQDRVDRKNVTIERWMDFFGQKRD